MDDLAAVNGVGRSGRGGQGDGGDAGEKRNDFHNKFSKRVLIIFSRDERKRSIRRNTNEM